MVAQAQAIDRGFDRSGPRPTGGSRAANPRPDRSRTILQNKRLHAAITDIADQLAWPPETGELHDVEWWKRRLTLQWLKETGETPDLIESLDGLQFALLLPHTSDLSTKQCAALNEWISIFGDLHGVTFGKMR
jgi:uncharacterized protein YgfB (UPF0149 family)